MIKLTDIDLERLGVEKRVGVRFETDLLDRDRAEYEIVVVLSKSVLVKRTGKHLPR